MRNLFLILLFLFPFFANAKSEISSLEALFVEKKCVTCHVVGRGRFVGPDLYDVVGKYSDQEILKWIQNPQAIYKEYSKMPINEGYPPMPYLGINESDAKKLLVYIKKTNSIVNKGTKVRIFGSVKNFSIDKFINAQEVQLELVMADKIKSIKKVLTKNGKFNFDKLIGNIAYRIKIFYDGIEYSTDKFYFLPREINKVVDLIVYDSTQNIANISVNSAHLIINYEEDSSSIIIAEIINVENQSKSIFVGPNSFSEKVRKINSYSLFSGILNLGFPHRGEDTFIVSDDKVIDTLPMPPGNRRIVFTYGKELNLFSTKIGKTFMNDIDSLTIIVPESKLSLNVEGLEYTKKKTEIKELADEKYSTYSIVNIKKGDAISLQFKKYDFLLDTKTIVGFIFIFFLVGISLYRRYKK
tara:strand:- start:926 stop:2161 length:1236 start_codon:yes stop_codon:yes gene_type:complete